MRCTDTTTLRTVPQALGAWLHFPSPWLLALVMGLAFTLRMRDGAWHWLDVMWVLLGLLLWPWLEWVLHRHVLHLRPRRIAGRQVDFVWARKHRAHHADPSDPLGILLPPALHGIAGGLLLLAAYLSPDRAAGFSLVFGLTLAALNYEWTHFLVHTRVIPGSRYYQSLFRAHRLHHYRNPNYWFGFTWTQVDRWLGTAPDSAAAPGSPRPRDREVNVQPTATRIPSSVASATADEA